ncbi:acyl-CoA dehydrogenase family protein [Vallitalea guaymasensis]|uniref:acyl-CoA dehydrogenase family protein n=1 Tax=Vallitalea guaymasensis TaxID=1185412 RepID=UPI000DE2F2CB|nr:acyl-CoA dehydrogenase family protein [Vallitalea guaymasensis]
MVGKLDDKYLIRKDEIRQFVQDAILPYVRQVEDERQIPKNIIKKLAIKNYLGVTVEKIYGGLEWDPIEVALLHEEFGKSHASVENLLTVYGMVIKAIATVGDLEQKKKWLTQIVRGEVIPAFAMTEPLIGSDIKNITTTAFEEQDKYVITGEKQWITLGQIADVFLVFAKCNKRSTAFLVERETPGLTIEPMSGTMGLKGNMLAKLHFNQCCIPKKNLLGKVGRGLSRVASYGLDEGRYTTACGSLGLCQACLDASYDYINNRKQFDVYLKEHQLVQKMITEMIVHIKAARKLCYGAGYMRREKDPRYIQETLIAKYYASKTANMVANHAIQIHGALGTSCDKDLERYYRDAKMMEIIEGSSQLYEIQIAKAPLDI